MAFGLGDLLQTCQQGVTAINNLAQKIATIFPQVTGSSTSAPATNGTVTFSSSLAVGFILTTTSSGATVKVPYYNQ